MKKPRRIETFEGFPIACGVLIDVDKVREYFAGRKPNARANVDRFAKIIRKRLVELGTKRIVVGKSKREPVLMARVCGIDVLFDGWHRIAEAKKRGRKAIPAHRMTLTELRPFAMKAEETRKPNDRQVKADAKSV